VAIAAQGAGQGPAEEAGATGDEQAHASI
jgi:hypothetical protein